MTHQIAPGLVVTWSVSPLGCQAERAAPACLLSRLLSGLCQQDVRKAAQGLGVFTAHPLPPRRAVLTYG